MYIIHMHIINMYLCLKVCLMHPLGRVTIRPVFPGHVLFFGPCPGSFSEMSGFCPGFNQSVPDRSKTWLLAEFFPSLFQFDRSVDTFLLTYLRFMTKHARQPGWRHQYFAPNH